MQRCSAASAVSLNLWGKCLDRWSHYRVQHYLTFTPIFANAIPQNTAPPTAPTRKSRNRFPIISLVKTVFGENTESNPSKNVGITETMPPLIEQLKIVLFFSKIPTSGRPIKKKKRYPNIKKWETKPYYQFLSKIQLPMSEWERQAK